MIRSIGTSFRPFGGLYDDVRRRLPYFLTDFTDAFTSFSAASQCLSAILYLFFANLTNIITFGGVMSTMLHGEMVSGVVVLFAKATNLWV